SVFINEMMLPQDTQNVEFATNAVTWLKGGQRQRVLFVEEGRIETKLEIPLKSISIPAEEALRLLFERRNDILQSGDRLVAQFENENSFNRKLLEVLARAGVSPS